METIIKRIKRHLRLERVLFADLDGTIIVTKSGNTFPKNCDDWQFKKGIIEAIEYYNPTHLHIVSNQGGLTMEQKRVSFEVAKAIKEAGYPQGDLNSGNCDVYPLESHDINYNKYTRVGVLTTRYKCETWKTTRKIPYVVAPTYLDVWLWLWKEKGIEILRTGGIIVQGKGKIEVKNIYDYQNPEEAIITAIEYLVENNLIK